ncbi:MAG: aminopeptidase, partial [Casimicrobium sp.]
GIEMTFKDGRVIEARASKNERSLHQILETDEGAARLGEVALAAESSAVAKTGFLFYDTLFDETAACHIALGKAYSYTMHGGHAMSKPELEQHGANDSRVHVDWMIGSKDLDVTGIRADGSSMALLSSGEWAFEV